MKHDRDGGPVDLDGPLEQWARAFVGGSTWRASLRDGMDAMVEVLRADPDAVRRCPLLGATVAGERSSALGEARERARDHVLALMHEQWARCQTGPAPGVYFEVFVGEMCALMQRSLDRGAGYDDLPEVAMAMWGPGSDGPSLRSATVAA